MKKGLGLLLCAVVLLFGVSLVSAATQTVIIEGEKFTADSKASVGTPPGRVEASAGLCVTAWDTGLLVYEVDVPETNDYKVVLRLSNGRSWTIYRDFSIDGAYPAEEFKKIACRPCGGFCKDANNWDNVTVSNDKGEPVFIKITAGKHIIRINNLGGDGGNGGAGFDCFGLLTKDVDSSALGKVDQALLDKVRK